MKANLINEEVLCEASKHRRPGRLHPKPRGPALGRYTRLGKITVHDETITEEIRPRISDAQIIITNRTPLIAETLAPPKQKGIC